MGFVDKITGFFGALGESSHVVGTFPFWLKVLSLLSALYVLIFGGVFIYYYSRNAALLKASAILSAIERQALSGDVPAMTELSFSDSPRAFDIISSVLRNNLDEKIRVEAVNLLSNSKDSRKVQVLGDTLVSEKWLVAQACARALGRSNDPTSIPYLLLALKLKVDWVVAQASAEALGRFPPNDSIARALVSAMDAGESFEAEAAKQSLVHFGEFSLPYLLRNAETSTSAGGLIRTISTIRILAPADSQGALTSLRQSRIRILQNPDLAQNKALTEEYQMTIGELSDRGKQ
jgi:HEAT repeat protein